jgi:hypothetical protein
MLAAAGALLLAPLAAVAGLYQAQQIEVGAALELKADGAFRYQLDYGAVSEHAEGRWTSDGKNVVLTTQPRPVSPRFELVRHDPAPAGQIKITLEPPGFGDGYRVDAIATDAASGEKRLVDTDSEGRVQADGKSITALEFLVPVYGMRAGRFDLDPKRGHRLLLRFHANDLTTANFDREPLIAGRNGLVLKRYDTEIRFMRVGP